MKKKFTKKFLNKKLISGNASNELRSAYSCYYIAECYPKYITSYKKFLQEEFKFDPTYTLWDSKRCESTSSSNVTLLRVLLLQSFEDAILNGEVKCLKN